MGFFSCEINTTVDKIFPFRSAVYLAPNCTRSVTPQNIDHASAQTIDHPRMAAHPFGSWLRLRRPGPLDEAGKFEGGAPLVDDEIELESVTASGY